METSAAVLHHFGVDAERVAHLAQMWAPAASAVAARFADLLARSADPALALAGWERLFEVSDDAGAVAQLTAQELEHLSILLGGSLSLSNTLQAAEERWVQLFRAAQAAPLRSAAEHEHDLLAATAEPWEILAERLRQHCHREYLRIGLADLTGRYPVDTTMQQLSELAAGLFAAAYHWARHSLDDQYGALPACSPQQSAGFVVLAMGKLGGGELNFSSDVDVMYLYASEQEETAGGA